MAPPWMEWTGFILSAASGVDASARWIPRSIWAGPTTHLEKIEKILADSAGLLENHRTDIPGEKYEQLKDMHKGYDLKLKLELHLLRASPGERDRLLGSQQRLITGTARQRVTTLLNEAETFHTNVITESNRARAGPLGFADSAPSDVHSFESASSVQTSTSTSSTYTSWYSVLTGSHRTSSPVADPESGPMPEQLPNVAEGAERLVTSRTLTFTSPLAEIRGLKVTVALQLPNHPQTVDLGEAQQLITAVGRSSYRRIIAFENDTKRVEFIGKHN
ncbi:hypothetical protein FRC07_006814 [Ceratobasidium sp. 392]|nr:hypothetical protein FRC07_006814 [Ceratobasidium sp. 392]